MLKKSGEGGQPSLNPILLKLKFCPTLFHLIVRLTLWIRNTLEYEINKICVMDTLKNNNRPSEQYSAYQAKTEIQHDL